jgi:FkbM family methyltransferase
MTKSTSPKILIANFMKRKEFQPLYNRFLNIALTGMGVGNGSSETLYDGEVHLLKYILKRKSKDNTVLFDVGANIGKYSQLLLEIFQEKAEIYAFEPGRISFEQAQDLLKGAENIHLYNAGFGKTESSAFLIGTTPTSVRNFTVDNAQNHYDTKYREAIELFQLDSFCQKMNITHIDLLKIDTEGAEIDILGGAKNLLQSQSIDIIQFEFSDRNDQTRILLKDFVELFSPNYVIHRMLVNGLYPITKIDKRITVFSSTNYVALSKNAIEKYGIN